MKEVFIIAAKRTPIGGFMGSLSGLSATRLGAIAIQGTYESISLRPDAIDSVYMGNVLGAGIGQSPARQAAIFSDIPVDKDATTINKVCASGMKATMIGAQQIQLGLENTVMTGGMESMSNVPHYTYLRQGKKLGDSQLTDGLIKDGLWDVYNDFHMGSAAELGVKKYGHTRKELDDYALLSYHKAQEATAQNKFSNELVPVSVEGKKGSMIISKDEDIDKLIPEKISVLKPAFEPNGLLTAANSSNLNDGAAALLLGSQETIDKYQITPLAKIIAYADAAQAPEWFTTSPSVAINKILKQTGLSLSDIDYFEINEAYASVILSNQKILGYDLDKVNIYGGAVALGHPIGASGARIVTTLVNVLRQEGGKYGIAAICNGGGGASAVLIENLG
ncbi:acetyl-CoA C-acyltransferase [Chryseobacterium indologenes]|uniref:acetyl-CoA C-acyltransferase n=1 Tax=Chryseobacterium indologenes TaxID=253 RepID=UPI000F4ECCC5|nr:acetyl-CoA C-acyltransferase [Chryseobacterium indologenes]AYZ35960.1 acetyl-CoA C-acyltransferase [Chryseobacterium indologenes]MBF6644745.1 acetyl-CoA C-acyltransferase [Chryseobacterium indologenes]MBU3047296.1 acetyl-CoA C-acyltransferase [Chryseobacterium indologenes]MEB4759739.1 acetyl-CoA C-acyltransferase [Chryseobacterium indologenes]QQQ71563.1 acetyl-CoA C-acyltransferase [Chryseobacterium indologenes]